MTIQEFILKHTDRGECRCGKCFDRGDKPDPTGHAADVEFFTMVAVGNPPKEEFVALTKSCDDGGLGLDPLDGAEHSYLELGGWLGSQELALLYMGLGALLGVFELLTPTRLLGERAPKAFRMRAAQNGFVTIKAKKESDGSDPSGSHPDQPQARA